MKINFNNVRAQACFAYDRLCEKLNNSQEHEGYMLVDPNHIQKDMDSLRQMIGAIAMSYMEDDPDMKDVYAENYPGTKNMNSFEFKSGEEEED